MKTVPTDRVLLGTWPTPLEPAARLAEAIGLEPGRLWLKRDDLTGLGAGGNKVRKLEWTVAEALAAGADTLVTTGAPQSNHARLTAAAACRVGVRAVLVFPGPPPARASGNVVLDGLFGAQVEWANGAGDAEDAEEALATAALRVRDQLAAAGRHPALIPFGGTSAVGAHGYRLAAGELLEQKGDVDLVVCAVGSGGTMTGLVSGVGPGRVLGVDTGAMTDPRAQVIRVLREMGEQLSDSDLRLRTDQVGAGYSTLTPGAARAMRTAARTEGLVLDPIYTARALAGLISAIQDGDVGPGQNVVFLVSGGLPGLFGHEEAAEFGGAGLVPPLSSVSA